METLLIVLLVVILAAGATRAGADSRRANPPVTVGG